MEILLLALTIGLPIIKILLFPARTMGRGGSWTVVGAIMIVGLMMALWFGMQSLTDTVASPTAGATTPASADTSSKALDDLAKLF
jgi:hypothetical protein